MLGTISFSNEKIFSVTGQVTSILSLPFYEIALAQGGIFEKYRLHKTGRLFQSQRISRLLLPTDFHHWDFFKDYGLRPYDPLPVLQGLGDWIALHSLAKHGLDPKKSSVLIQGKRSSPEIWSVAEKLCPFVKELVISLEEGGDRLQAHLYREFGISPASFRSQTTATLSFSPEEEKQNGVFVQLSQIDSPDFCSITLKNKELPSSFPPLSLISLLLQTGKISCSSLEYT
ncbi:MAG: hypothetical protein R3Y63_01325 [Eubacteriales bacterium]